MIPEDDWQQRLQQLAGELAEKGQLTDPRWHEVFTAVPRHRLVPSFYLQDRSGWRRVDAEDPEYAELIYANRPLHTDVDGRGHGVSSTSKPGLMTRMLELLELQPHHRVLEIGTGTGYNTALLCAFLDDDKNVCSVDIDYIEQTRARLASLGYRPVLRQGDGVDGMPEGAPFDRIIATVAVRAIPAAWRDQLAEGGMILADLKLSVSAGNLVRLRNERGHLVGRFDDTGYAAFMAMRHFGRQPEPAAPPASHDSATQSTTTCPAQAWEEGVPWFLAAFDLPHGVVTGMRLSDTHEITAYTYAAPDGSWAVVEAAADAHGHHAVTQAGPTPLWDIIEAAFARWTALGRPGWGRFGLTVASAAEQTVWLDQPDSPHRWSLTDQPQPAG